jgi:hypothetical protein
MRSVSFQVYLRPDFEPDAAVIEAVRAFGPRRQEGLRRMLRAGARALAESGEIPPAAGAAPWPGEEGRPTARRGPGRGSR